MLNPNLIYLNFGGKWVSKPEYLIQINRFKFQNIPSGSFATCSIKDKNGNKGIALLSHKTVKKINNKTLLSKYSSGFSPEAEQKASEILKRYIQRFKTYSGNISQHRAIFLNSICSDSGVCIAFGKQAKRISKHFNGFVNFEYVISVDQIGPTTINGFVKEITYEHFGYKANAILKSSNKKDSDNLLFEYLVGQYINKQCMVFPCFIETYGWYQYNTSTDRKNMKFNKVLDKNALKSSLEIGQIALQNYIDLIEDNICFENKQHWQTAERECTEIESLLKLACAKSKYLAVLTQHIKDASNIDSMIKYTSDDEFSYNDLLNVLYQVYMPLATLSETFTHYDLNAGNLLIYEPVNGKYIDYKYVLINGDIVEFKCRYIAKIIDYGRCFFKDNSNKEISGSSKSIYESICKNIKECNAGGKKGAPVTYCGEDQGFSCFDENGIGYSINSTVRNTTHDLILLYRIKKQVKDSPVSLARFSNPLLQTIFDKSEYGREKLLSKKEYEYGSVELYDTSPILDDGMPEKINNVIDAHIALKKQVLENKLDNDLYHATMTSLGSLTIYESGRAMEFIEY